MVAALAQGQARPTRPLRPPRLWPHPPPHTRPGQTNKSISRVQDDSMGISRVKNDSMGMSRVKDDSMGISRVKDDSMEISRVQDDSMGCPLQPQLGICQFA